MAYGKKFFIQVLEKDKIIKTKNFIIPRKPIFPYSLRDLVAGITYGIVIKFIYIRGKLYAIKSQLRFSNVI